LGSSTGFTLTPGQACDLDGADLLPQITADMVIADKAFDANERVIEPLERASKSMVVPLKATASTGVTTIQNLQSASPHREFLRQTQAVPRHRHQIMTSALSISWPESTSPRLSSGSIEDRP
jgi:hypothetical protein